MTAREVTEWQAYEQVYGSMLVHERIDAGLARVAFMLSNGQGEFREFMPQWWQDLTAEAERERGIAWLRGLAG